MERSSLRFAAADLTRAIGAIVAAGGSDSHECDLVASNLVAANLAGHDSHGVGIVPRYVDSLLEGGLAVNRTPIVRLDTGTLLVLDGDAGYGQSVGARAMELAIERAKQHGVCVLGLHNVHHIGRIGHWAEQAVAAGLVSIHFVNVLSRPIVAPWGGRDARFGTNPFCVGVPVPRGAPVILDMATSAIAQGKARVAFNQGVLLSPGKLLDKDGEPTTDPRFGVKPPYGALLPMGEHKGYGLAMVCELLGGALAGGRTWRGPDTGKRRVQNGMFAILIDPQALGTDALLEGETNAFIEWVKASPAARDGEGVLVAGEPERRTRKQRLAEGIPMDANSWDEILRAAAKLGADASAVDRIARGQ
jgi:uncharacterized oxidoreductase